MVEDKFEVVSDNGEVIASNMRMDMALMFIEAYFNKYYKENKIALIIRKMTF